MRAAPAAMLAALIAALPAVEAAVLAVLATDTVHQVSRPRLTLTIRR